ncbi:CesT family type III secretion system chaperone [Parachitinimonas caeni]|uniref:CesT family type III secretion system chaperone n=1 Tax=Parachitinimonas caeni TaxID=3031301 RepID=A0ABT7DXZ8_9NEIS|nr:CesT family type III secretion system chaperone [Parachitinimonas caeni]MDK2124938.1 CesT family type III secretion system chaperone [Parachitinimonas caeni]
MSDRFNDLIESLATTLGLDNAQGLSSPVVLTIEDMPLTIAYDARSGGDDILLYASLGTVPEAQELTVYRAMLEGNLLWSATADATLGVNSATREGMIAYRLPMDKLDGEGLSKLIAHFSEVALGWRDFVSNAGRADQAADDASSGQPARFA